ncbi:MAG: FKBP-type peptidyl-prolyl cis-trans isomerase [Candidatus Nanohaloarchaea archaeon]|nr:FKBP-type peptidyl-prolyl cis-trans isomerase [Candidatus Nanohaloarchaea archaeon]
MPLEDRDVIKVNYIGRIQSSGEIFDLTDQEVAEEEGIDQEDRELKPVKIVLGEGYILESLEDKIKDLDVGEKESFEIPKEDAFGSRESDKIETISRREFEEHEVRPHRGMPVEIDGKQGKILSASSGRVKVDFNHPLAGRDLEYTVEVLDKIEDMEEQVKAVLEFHGLGDADIDIDEEEGNVKVDAGELPEELTERMEEELEKLEKVEKASLSAGED